MKENAGNPLYNVTWDEKDSRDKKFDVAMVTVGNVSVEGYRGGEVGNKVSDFDKLGSELSEFGRPKN